MGSGSSGVKTWVLCLLLPTLPHASAVCQHCFGQLDGCTGGDDCPFLKSTAANAAVAVATTGAAVFSLTQLLPREYLKVMTRTVLDTLLVVVRRPLPGATPNISGWTVQQLLQGFKDQTVPRADIVAELTTLIAGSDEAQRDTIKLALESMKMYSTLDGAVGANRTGETQGVLQLLWALAGRIVLRGNDTLTVTVEKSAAEASVAAKITEKMTRPSTSIEFCERIAVFSQLAHALGVCNILASTRFFRYIAYDTMLRDKMSWEVAHELVMVYFEDIDNSTTLTMGNVIENGGQDSRLARAKVKAGEHFKANSGIFREGDGGGKTGDALKWNGKDSPNSTICCASWNLGNEHPVKSLFAPSGKCKYKHACDRYVSDDGKQCGSKDHKRDQCDHADRKPLGWKKP